MVFTEKSVQERPEIKVVGGRVTDFLERGGKEAGNGEDSMRKAQFDVSNDFEIIGGGDIYISCSFFLSCGGA